MSIQQELQTKALRKSRTIRKKVTETGKLFDQLLLEPWFLPKKAAFEILALLPRGYRERMMSYYQDYGCLRCNRKNIPYGTNGFCDRCNRIVRLRLARCLKKRANKLRGMLPIPQISPDTLRMSKARELLADLAPKKLKLPKAYRMRKSQFANPERLSLSPSSYH